MIKEIINVQKQYKISRIKEITNILLAIIERDLQETENFDKFTKKLQNRSLLKIVSIFLHRINRYFNVKNDVSSRVFLSAFVISYYPDIVLSSTSKLETELYKTSKLLINITRKIRFDNYFMTKLYLYKFKNIFNNFSVLFSLWKFIDKEEIIEMLAKRYNSINKTIDFIKKKSKFDEKTKNESIIILENQLIDINNKAKQIDIKINENVFKNYDKIINSLTDNMSKAFWDKLSLEIKEERYNMIIDVINDIIKSICSYIPNRKDIHDEIKENVNIDIIKQLIENKVFSIKSLYEYSNYLYEYICKLSIPSRIEDFDKVWDNINFDDYFYIVVPKIFKLLYEMIDILYIDISFIY